MGLKNTQVELELLTNIDMLLMVEKELEAECFKQYIDLLKQTINIRKIMIKTKNNHISNIWIQTLCIDGQCLKNFLQIVLNG